MAKALSGIFIATVFVLAISGGTALAVPSPAGDFKPRAPGLGVQAGVTSFVIDVNRAETQIKHESTIVAPTTAGSSYSYSLVGITDTGYVLRMGYIVLAGENGLARWFIRVYNSAGAEVYWNMSRAGAANPPPACSACSGDTTTQGYPYSFGWTGTNTVSFWFDWILKARVKLTGVGSSLKQVYFLGEVNNSEIGMDPRKALTTYRVTKGQGTWTEPASADVYYSSGASCKDTDGAQYADFDVQHTAGDTQVRNDGQTYKSTTVGSLLSDGVGATVSPGCGPFTW